MSRTRTGYTGVTGRILITALDASGLIVGAFLNWTRDTQGTHVSWRSLYQDTFGAANNIVQSVGGLSILVGLVAVLGLAESSGWLTRLAGAPEQVVDLGLVKDRRQLRPGLRHHLSHLRDRAPLPRPRLGRARTVPRAGAPADLSKARRQSTSCR
jgi:hypothetical protein